MPRRESFPVGAPCWVDLLSTDPDQSRAFYTELLGWKAEEPNPEFGGYWMFTKDDLPIAGGMVNDGSGAPDGWSVYLTVDDARATIDRATAAGAQVVVPAMQVADLGTMGVVIDPGGATIGLWKPEAHTGFGIVGEVGAPGWFELHTRAYDASLDFYRDVFRWETQVHSDSPEFRYSTVGAGDDQEAGVMDAAANLSADVPSFWSVYFRVDDTDAALTKIARLGGAVVEAAQDTPYGRLATATDPTGARFKLMA